MEDDGHEPSAFNHQQHHHVGHHPSYPPTPGYTPNHGYQHNLGYLPMMGYQSVPSFIQHTPNDNFPYNFDGPLPAPIELINSHNWLASNPLDADKPVNANQSLLGAGMPSHGQQKCPDPPNDVLPSSSTPPSLPTCRASNSATRRNKQTQEEIEESNNLAAAKKAEKTRKVAKMAEKKRQKQAQKQARAAIKIYGGATLHQGTQANYNKTSKKRPGCLVWSLYVHKYCGPKKDHYITIRELKNEVIFWRYKALMTHYKTVLDFLKHSGSGGLYEVLAEHGMAEEAWDFIKEMHGVNPAASGAGVVDMNATIGDMMANLVEDDPVDNQQTLNPDV
ncbi:hypothetical protein PCANC_26710 [Puccinia coronata f. sp. avenae]|uniref:Uncharacterized protein n=1 Tax=Puccinia coronata f. sp. avenae TaxID=200324 RepID=A0A2N5S917_9BASI|nr:hypothetical protein PCANC_26710 [Puccinia coronata f. sp. avenae]